MNPAWIWAAPPNRIRSCTLFMDPTEHAIIILNMVMSLLKLICTAKSIMVLTFASTFYQKEKYTLLLTTCVYMQRIGELLSKWFEPRSHVIEYVYM